MIIRSKAPVRISFGTCGDSDYYTDLIGYGNGVNATISLYSYCEIHPRSDGKVVLRSLETRQVLSFDSLQDINLGDRSLNLMKVAALHYKNAGIEVVTYADAPLNSGLGGSSAHAVALIKAFDAYNKIERTPEEIARLAYEWERNILKLEGGYQDQWAASYGGLNYMEFRSGEIKITPLKLPEKDLQALERDLILVYIPREKSSHEVHFEQRQKGEESIPILNMKRENILKLKECLEQCHFDDIGRILHLDWKIKRQLAPSITNDRIEQIYESALDAGAQGGRFIGAGAGGSALFYAPGKRGEVLHALEKFGSKELKFRFERGLEGPNFVESIRKDVQSHRDIVQSILDNEKVLKSAEMIAHRIVEAYRNNGKLIVFGNGGSAADAQHIVGELVNYFRFDRPMLNAIALTVNTSVMTAIANDSSYDNVFSRQIESLARNEDVVIGISTSGKAESVYRALKKAKERDATVVFFTGATGGKISEDLEKDGTIDISLKIPSKDTPRIQEAHMMLGHIICEIVERELYGK